MPGFILLCDYHLFSFFWGGKKNKVESEPRLTLQVDTSGGQQT